MKKHVRDVEISRGKSLLSLHSWHPVEAERRREHRSKTSVICWCLPLVRPSQEPEQSIPGDVVSRAQPRRVSWRMDLRSKKGVISVHQCMTD